ncbi:hypothetical protein SJI19_19600 [Acerihabitans sp. TG2]|uniref:hypothetical protein n=1 Tax=Acerihabitans sp. TG2 TaxID=3096008 RepID=UPI002B223864|nr:hypothetical protein [Acerihabitans sp. TG2]MEA9392714.1 hypothetical protein [Acerihabitans sp. TG2]
MKVYCTPVKIVCTSGRFGASTFLDSNAKTQTTGMDYLTLDKNVFFRFYEDKDVFSCVILTIKSSKSYVSASQIKQDFTLSMHGTGKNSISEANMLIINKKNLHGVYVHNEGSMHLSMFESKFRGFYNLSIKKTLGNKKRDEKIAIERIVDDATLMDKISKYSFVDEINATFYNSVAATRFLNSSVYNKTKSIRVTMRTNKLSIKAKNAKVDLADYLNTLVNAQAGNVSFKGRTSSASDGETVGVIDKANSIETLDHDDYLTLLNGMKLSAFLSSDVYKGRKKIVLSHRLTKS